MTNKRSLKKTSKDFAQILSANVVVQLVGILSLTFFARHLNKLELTAIPIYTTIGSFGAILLGFGVFPVSVKLIPTLVKNKDIKAYSIAKTIININLVGGVIYTILTFLIASELSSFFFQSYNFENIIKLMCIGFFFVSMGTTNTYLLKSFSRFSEMSKVLLFKSISQTIVSIILFILIGWNGLVLGLVLGSLLQYVLGVFYLKDIYNSKVQRFPLKNLFSESWSFYLESFLMYARKEGDILIVTTFLGPQSLAIYFIAQKILIGLNSLYDSLNTVLRTRLSSFRGNHSKFLAEVNLLLRFQVNVLLPLICLFIICVPWLIDIIAGEDYIDSILPGSILSLTPFIQYLFVLSYNAIIFLFMPSKSRFILTAVNTFLLFTCLFIFSSLFAVIGIAVGRVLSFLFTGMFAVYFVKRNNYYLNFPIMEFVRMTLILIISFGYLIFSQIYYGLELFHSIGLFLTSSLVFLLLVSLFISEQFYSSINQLSPINIKDPIKLILHEVRGTRNA